MTKVLVCGSAGFLMSNLMRYMLYRTKDYDFASVDRLRDANDFHRVYQHRKHSFNIGDAGDQDFMDRLVWMEKPDIIVVATSPMMPPRSIRPSTSSEVRDIVLPTATACHHAKRGLFYASSWKWPHVIRLVPDEDILDMGAREMWRYVESMVVEANGTVLRLPVCFGRRGNGRFEELLGKFVPGQMTYEPCDSGANPDRQKRRYAYAEDVSSMLWFIMERRNRGVVRMPALAVTSPIDMLETPSEGYLGMEDPMMPGWLPDSQNMEEAVAKTIKWYTMNKWVFKNYEESLFDAIPRPPAGNL